jgi:hypothetical protein
MGFLMAEEEKVEGGQKNRREFVKTAAQVAIATPTAMILLNGTSKAQAAESAYPNQTSGSGDDFSGITSDDAGSDDPISSTPGDDFVP